MTRTTVQRPPFGRARVILIALMLTLVAADRDRSPPSGTVPPWQPQSPVSIKVRAGQAHFTIPTPERGARTLVIVSALSRGAGPFPIRLSARGVSPDQVAAPETEPGRERLPRTLNTAPLPSIPPPARKAPPHERSFQLMVRDGDVASASNYVSVDGKLRAVGHRIQIYVDARDVATVKPEVLRDLMTTFDDRIFPVAAKSFGQARDVDEDGRFTVLMSSWLTRLAGGRHAVDGFVRGADLDLALAAPFSNHCDMMYLSTLLEPGPYLRSVLAHEYTHAVTFSAKALPLPVARRSAPEEEGWLDEALAHLVEDLHGFSHANMDYRVSAFLSRPERYRLVVDDYYAADLFRSHGNRGGTYLFLRWCVDRFGPELISTLIRSDRQGIANLEAATGMTFADLYRSWSLALFFSGFDPSGPRESDFRSLEIRGAFGECSLAGPRTVSVEPDGPELSWMSAGTASRFAIVGPSREGAAEITVTAPSEAGLQVTAVPLPTDLGEMTLLVRAVAVPDGPTSLRVDVRERNGTPIQLHTLAWEPLQPAPDPHSPGFHRARLDQREIAATFGTSALPASGRLSSSLIPASGALDGPRERLVVKAVGTDAQGRRVSAWAELAETDDAGPGGD